MTAVDIYGPEDVVTVARQGETFRCLCGGQEKSAKNFRQRHYSCFFPGQADEQDDGNRHVGVPARAFGPERGISFILSCRLKC